MIKKFLCFILAAFTAFALVGCGNNADEASDSRFLRKDSKVILIRKKTEALIFGLFALFFIKAWL